jgi:hypothetical protein
MSETNMKPENPNSNQQGADSVSDSVKRFKALTEKAPAKVPFLKSTAFKFGVPVVFGLATFEAGGMAYTEFNNYVPISAHTLQVDALHPWNIGLEGKQQGTELVLGQNARYATDTEIQDFIHSPLPPIKPDSAIKTPADLPRLGIVAGIDLSKSGKVEWYNYGPVQQAGPLVGQRVPSLLVFTIENKDTPIGIFIPEGIDTDSVEIFLKKPVLINGKLQYGCFIEKFNLGNGEYAFVEMDIDFLPSEILKDAPMVDPNHPKEQNFWYDMMSQQGKKFSISDNPTLALTAAKNSTGRMDFSTDKIPGILILHLQTESENTLFIAPS